VNVSHQTTIDIEIRDIPALLKACAEMGFPLLQGVNARGWNGKYVRSDYCIQLPGEFDVSLTRNDNGAYKVTADLWDGSVERVMGAGFGRLKQLYGVHKAISEASKAGLRAMRSIQSDGSIRLTLSK
jgi:hypothetical protein